MNSPKTQLPSQYMTINEVADLFRYRYTTVWNKIREQQIPSVKIGRRVLIHRSDVERMLAAGRRQPAKQAGDSQIALENAPPA
jgi:excisionase family DNA binding protein